MRPNFFLLGLNLSAALLCSGMLAGERVAEKDPKALLAQYEREIKPLLTQFCYTCHGNGKTKGKVSLEEPVTIQQLQNKTSLWLSALEQVSSGSMPPSDEAKTPDKKQAELITKWIAEAVAAADRVRPRDPGFVALHRLNRTEYNNTIRDLTGVSFKPAQDFPADDSGYGFDNIADVLTMSPLLAEKYVGAAEQVVELVVKEALGEPIRNPLALQDAKPSGASGRGAAWVFPSNGNVTFSLTLISGAEYVLHFEASQDAAGDEDAKMALSVDGQLAGTITVNTDKPTKFPVRFKATKESHALTFAFINDFYDPKAKDRSRTDRNLRIESVELEGPFNAPVANRSKKVFSVSPAKGDKEADAAEKIIRAFARKAFRRPVRDPEIKGLLKLYATARKNGGFEHAVGAALTGVLVSPHFLFRVERKPPGDIKTTTDNPSAGWALDDHELAVRLSYYLWSTMPDDELFALAEKGKLQNKKVREEQVLRMLKDPRASQLVENFAGQWLELRNLDEIARDRKLFPMYNEKLADAMIREAILFFDSIMREDRSILNLVDADYTFVNEPLGKIYGLEVKGDEFQRVELKNSPRGGVITMSSTLALTANPTRTSPVKRGKWVLEQMLGAPPPPPPPEVPTLPEKPTDQEAASLRQRLEKHRADPNCAVCHLRMDGLGFALENFDSIGRWRDMDGKFPIDATGELPGGEMVKGARQLKALVLKRKSAFSRNFIEKMMTYALGRGVKQYDRKAVSEMLNYVAQNEYKFSSVVQGIVNSDAFLLRREKRGDE